MKLWIVNHFAYGPDQSAGTRHYALARALQGRGHESLVIASSFYHKGREEARLEPGEKYRCQSLEGVPFQWVRTPPYQGSPIKRLWNMAVFAWRTYRAAWRKEGERPDVVLGSSPSLLAALAAYLLARRLRVPFVLEIRDIWPDALRDIGNLSVWNPVFLLFKCIERFLYKNSDAILTVIPNSFGHIIAHGGKRNAITWIPNGVDLKQRPILEGTELESPFTITYFGAHGPYSGLEQLIEAAAILERKGWTSRDIRFVLIGDPPKEELVEGARERGVSGMFEFRDAVPKWELWKAIDGTDVFLMIARPIEAHKKGISPNKLWEYFAAARPVLFSIYWGSEMAEESGGGIAVTPGDPFSLAEGVERLYSLPPETRDRMGVSGRRYVEKTAEMAKLGERLEQVLGRLDAYSAGEGAGSRLD